VFAPPATPAALLERMMLVRRFGATARALQPASRPGVLPMDGGEAVAVGLMAGLDSEDLVLINQRNVGQLIARGARPGRLLAEVLGGPDDHYGAGRGQPHHIAVNELRVLLTAGTGAALSLTPSIAFSHIALGRPGIVVCFFHGREGHARTFRESLCQALEWKLPVLYFAEYGAAREAPDTAAIAARLSGTNVDRLLIDGSDVEAVAGAVRDARTRVRQGGRPFVIESTIGTAGASGRDPIRLLSRRLLAGCGLTRTARRDMAARVARQFSAFDAAPGGHRSETASKDMPESGRDAAPA
jgi:acetoin:2,6-dichlorophenolindophenol oxidoreductase subunit alpha